MSRKVVAPAALASEMAGMTRAAWALYLVEGFFSKLARSVLRHIRVASKQELKKRIMVAIDDINQHPIVHSWSYKLDQAA